MYHAVFSCVFSAFSAFCSLWNSFLRLFVSSSFIIVLNCLSYSALSFITVIFLLCWAILHSGLFGSLMARLHFSCLPACDYPFLPNGLHLRATVSPPSCVCIRPCFLVFFVGLSCLCVHISMSEPFCAPHAAILKSPRLPSCLSSCPFCTLFSLSKILVCFVPLFLISVSVCYVWTSALLKRILLIWLHSWFWVQLPEVITLWVCE